MVTPWSFLVEVVQHALTTSAAQFVGWTTEKLCSAQVADPDISSIRRWMERGEEDPPGKMCHPMGQQQRPTLAETLPKGSHSGTKLLHDGRSKFYPQIILPQVFQKDVMQQMHKGAVGGHFGVERALS